VGVTHAPRPLAPNGSPMHGSLDGARARRYRERQSNPRRSRAATLMVGVALIAGMVPSLATDASTRTHDGLLALYTFADGKGGTVADVSGRGEPLDLTIAQPGSVTWGASSLRIDAATTIVSPRGSNKLNTAITASNALTLEAWVTPANTTQAGPARIATLSRNHVDRNVTLGQEAGAYEARLRTSTTDSRASQRRTTTTDTAASTRLQHVVFTRAADGDAKLYLDGQVVATTATTGDLSTWQSEFQFALGNEINGDRAWLGSLHLVAVYDRVLDAAEITQNRQAGPSAAGPSAPAPQPEPEPDTATDNDPADVTDPIAEPTTEPAVEPEPELEPDAEPEPVTAPSPAPSPSGRHADLAELWSTPPTAVVSSWSSAEAAAQGGAKVIHLRAGRYPAHRWNVPGSFIRNVPGESVVVTGAFEARAANVTLAGVEISGRFEGRGGGDGATLYRSLLTGNGAVTFNGGGDALLGRLIEVHSLHRGSPYSGVVDDWSQSNIVTVNQGASVEVDGSWIVGRDATKDVIQLINSGRNITVRNSYLGRGPSATLHLITSGKVVIENTYLDWWPHPIGGGIGWEMRSSDVTLRNVTAFRPYWAADFTDTYSRSMTIEDSEFYTVSEIRRAGNLLFKDNVIANSHYPANAYRTEQPPSPIWTAPSWWSQLG
jgi:hypothetical protein